MRTATWVLGQGTNRALWHLASGETRQSDFKSRMRCGRWILQADECLPWLIDLPRPGDPVWRACARCYRLAEKDPTIQAALAELRA